MRRRVIRKGLYLFGGERAPRARERVKQQQRQFIQLMNADLHSENFARVLDLILELNQARPDDEKRRAQLKEKFDQITKPYQAFPQCELLDEGWKITWKSPFSPGTNLPDYTLLLSLGDTSTLRRVRRCLCGRWYLARRGDQNFHNKKCKYEDYKSNEDFKRKRAEAFKKWYWSKNGPGGGKRKGAERKRRRTR